MRQFYVGIWGLVLLFALASATQSADGAVSVWLSDIGIVDGGFVPGELSVGFPGNENRSLYVWARNDVKLRSLALDLATTTSDVIEITGVEVFNPDLVVEGVTIGRRWNDPVNNGMISSDGESIANLFAVAIEGAGLDPATRIFDELYDPVADAALFARIDFTTGSYGGDFFGSTNTVLTEGVTRIVEAGNPNTPVVHFGTATIEIGFDSTLKIAVSGNDIPIENNDDSPSLLDGTDFDAVLPGSVQERTFAIEAIPFGRLNFLSPVITGPYSLVGDFPTFVEDSGSFTLALDTNAGLGDHPGSISFANNSDNAKTFSFALHSRVVPEPGSAVLMGLLFASILPLIRSRK